MDFKQLVEDALIEGRGSPVPVGSYDQLAGNLDRLVSRAETIVGSGAYKASLTVLKVNDMVDAGRLKATQRWLDPIGSGGEALFPGVDLPLVVQVAGVGYILDGHHRIAQAYETGEPVKVYWLR